MTGTTNSLFRNVLSGLPSASPRWLLAFAGAVAVGIALRLWALPDQILLDDEWHSLNFVIDKSFSQVFAGQGLGANCIPQNLYNWLLLHSVGWSETLLRLPSVLCGIAALVLFPLLCLRISGPAASLTFAWLLAVSPCVIFYSRLCRPYSMVLFFGFLSILSLVAWLRRDRLLYMLAYAAFGFLAIYYHLYAAIPVLTPLACLFVFSLSPQPVRERLARNSRLPPVRAMVLPGLIISGLALLFIVPANIGNPWWQDVQGVDRFTVRTFLNFLSLLSGTRFPELILAFAALSCLGLFFLLRSDTVFGILALAIIVVFFAFVALSTQRGMHAAIQIARYGITLFPLSFLLAAIGLNGLFGNKGSFTLRRPWQLLASALFIAALFFLGPLRETYARPNNYTNQDAFQDSYKPFDWSLSRIRDLRSRPQMNKNDIPALYFDQSVMSAAAGIIEYPQFIGDTCNLYYFYQHYHKKPVAAGYVPEFRFAQLQSKDDFVYQNTPFDYVLSRAAAKRPGKLRFKNMVPITDLLYMNVHFRDWLVVVHKDLIAEMFPGEQVSRGEAYQRSAILAGFLKKNIGEPVFEDNKTVVWRIK
ncbi:MAG: hypothetical protein ACLQU3_25285 [Limisphaerales bacterium]